MADGHIVYQGMANLTPEYFSKMGFNFNRFANPADIFMRILSINYPMQEEDNLKLDLLIKSYDSELRSNVNHELEKIKIRDFDLS